MDREKENERLHNTKHYGKKIKKENSKPEMIYNIVKFLLLQPFS